jgi:hypothetical protein
MKHFLLSIQQPDGGEAPPEILEPIMRNVDAFNSELKAAGAWVFAGGLDQPVAAVVTRVSGGDVITSAGPYLQGEEHLGGLSIILAPDLDSLWNGGRSWLVRRCSRWRSGNSKAIREITKPLERRVRIGPVIAAGALPPCHLPRWGGWT